MDTDHSFGPPQEQLDAYNVTMFSVAVTSLFWKGPQTLHEPRGVVLYPDPISHEQMDNITAMCLFSGDVIHPLQWKSGLGTSLQCSRKRQWNIRPTMFWTRFSLHPTTRRDIWVLGSEVRQVLSQLASHHSTKFNRKSFASAMLYGYMTDCYSAISLAKCIYGSTCCLCWCNHSWILCEAILR